MNGLSNQPQWEKLKYTKTEIKKAGKTIAHSQSEEEISAALIVIENWRAAHAYPLSVVFSKLNRLAKEETGVIVAQRLKRLDSLVNKLRRLGNTDLWKMQDIGGCRVIVPSIEDVYRLSKKYQESRVRHVLKKTYDYIQSPKVSGYRSLHLVYQFHSDENPDYNENMLIEIQLRTRIQHLWATTVETMDLFKNSNLKNGQGTEEDTRFFALASSFLARLEGSNIVPSTPEDTNSLLMEMKQLDEKNRYLDFLSSIKVATKMNESDYEENSNGYCVLCLNYETRHLSTKWFMPSKIQEAQEFRREREQQSKTNKEDCVLVRVSSFATLKEAYPNYYADISDFVDVFNRSFRTV